MIIKNMRVAGSGLAVWGSACALLFVCGCTTPAGFDAGLGDVRSFESLKLDAVMAPPSLIVAEGGLRKVVFSWPAPNDYVYRYRIERAEAVGGPFVIIANVDPDLRRFVDGETPETQLTENKTYFYRLIAVKDRRGPRSLPCAVLSSTTAPPPEPVTSLEAKSTGSRVNTLTWRPAGGVGISSYRIERALVDNSEVFIPVGNTKESSFIDGGSAASSLWDSTQYSYRIVTVNEVGSYSPPSECCIVTTFPPPAAVSDFTGVTGEVRCSPLRWKPSPERDVVAYQLYSTRGDGKEFQKLTLIQGRESANYIDGGSNPGSLEDEGLYLYQIKAVNAVGAESADSETVRIVTRPVPPVVQGVAAVSGMPREVLLTWDLSKDSSVVGYEIWRSIKNSDEWHQIKLIENKETSRYLDRGMQENLAELGGLLDGTGYVYRVISYNTGGMRSSASAPVVAETKIIPVAPSGVTASSGMAGVIYLSWNPNPEKDIKHYAVEVSSKESRGFKSLCTVDVAALDSMKAKEDQLKVCVERYYRIKAVANDRLQSEWSTAVKGITKALPDAPGSLQQSLNNGNLDLSWSPSKQTDIDHYNVWSKRLIGWKQIASTKLPESQIASGELVDISTVAVSAVDKDGLESEKSEPLKLNVTTK